MAFIIIVGAGLRIVGAIGRTVPYCSKDAFTAESTFSRESE